ncbi:MAG: hypothetical protein ACE5H8_07075 [Alphaproteobacteria bacterium]
MRAAVEFDRRQTLVCLAAAAILPASSAAPPLLRRPGPAPEEMLTFFDAVALTRRVAGGVATPGGVRRWAGPVAVHAYGAPGLRRLAGLRGLLARLSRWTGFDFDLAGNAADDGVDGGNTLNVYYLAHEEMMARYGGAVGQCATYGNGGRLHTGEIELSLRYTDCLRHELMHALGFDNHWSGPRATACMPSVLAHRYAAARAADFSPCDERAIRLLYDPRLAPGMPRETALPIAWHILEGRVTA